MKTSPIVLACATALAFAGCHKADQQKSVDALDKELTSTNAADPAVSGALQDQIMVDPQLASKANAHSIRPPDQPLGVPLPPSEHRATADTAPPQTLGQRAYASINPGKSGCNMAVRYSALWATKLPADLPIYPQGHVSEAAGSDTPTCHLRVVSFRSTAGQQTIADYYTSQGHQAGYEVGLSGDTLNGTRAKDGAMFSITLTAANSGTDVDIVSNAGR